MGPQGIAISERTNRQLSALAAHIGTTGRGVVEALVDDATPETAAKAWHQYNPTLMTFGRSTTLEGGDTGSDSDSRGR